MNMLLTNSFLISYLLPLSLMVFCYSRIVYALRTKVATDKTMFVIIMVIQRRHWRVLRIPRSTFQPELDVRTLMLFLKLEQKMSAQRRHVVRLSA